MARPPKSAEVIEIEGKSHRTKKELAVRKAAEKELLSGEMLKENSEIRNDKIAHREFLRVRRLLRSIKKDDEIYGNAVRRYCVTASKLQDEENSIRILKEDRDSLRGSKSDFEERGELDEYYRMLLKMEDTITKKESLTTQLRREMTDFEKENCMTIKSSLRTIPKQPETKTSALKEALLGTG